MLLLIVSVLLRSDSKMPIPGWTLGEPIIEIFNCLYYNGKTYYKNLPQLLLNRLKTLREYDWISRGLANYQRKEHET